MRDNRLIIWLCMLFIAAISLTIGNKVVAMNYRYHNLTLIFQNGCAILMLYFGKQINFFRMKPLLRKQFFKLSVPAILLSLQIATSLRALPHVAIATTVVFRCIASLCIAFIDIFLFEKAINMNRRMCLLVSFSGSILYAWQDARYSAKGYFWLTVNLSIYIVNSIYNKKTIMGMDQTADGVAIITQIVTIPVLLIFCIITGEAKELLFIKDFIELGTITKFVFIWLGGMGTLIAISNGNLFKIASVTTISVASNINKCICIIISAAMFHEYLSFNQFLGLVVCITGNLLYTYLGLSGREEKKNVDRAPPRKKKTSPIPNV